MNGCNVSYKYGLLENSLLKPQLTLFNDTHNAYISDLLIMYVKKIIIIKNIFTVYFHI